ncbi:MAG: Ldh family oxidoreductase [Pseudomonadota bacterium]
MAEVYALTELEPYLSALFEAAGLVGDRSAAMSRGFIEADLLGFPSHGVAKVAGNLRWLESGETAKSGDPTVLVDLPAVASWDANRLPGHWIMREAARVAIAKASEVGAFTLTIRRAQHVACLAASLVPIAEAGMVGLMMVSSPEEVFVSPFGGSERLFSNNPIAFTAPSAAGTVLFDVSMAITAGGQVARAARLGEPLPEAALKTRDGQVSADPQALGQGGSVMPVGGLGHGHKGHALTIMTEVLTQALNGFGREAGQGQFSEQNSVFLQVFNPAAFGDQADYEREMAFLFERIEGSAPDSTEHPIRVPGRGAWARRERQLREGITLDDGTLDRLLPFAEEAGLTPPVAKV